MAVSEREPALFLAFVILFASFEVFVFGVLGALGKSMLGAWSGGRSSSATCSRRSRCSGISSARTGRFRAP
jgi:hypothetical protein